MHNATDMLTQEAMALLQVQATGVPLGVDRSNTRHNPGRELLTGQGNERPRRQIS